MDYVEAFKNLRTNNKYGRKSPHKAVLMLTIIELYEQSIITDNEIYYDDTLKSMFLEVWNRVLPKEPLFHPEAYLPFWYLQSDSFWHIIPNRGKDDVLSLMRDTNIKPSEAKLIDSVKYAELDDDLYFLMTITSGRSSLKRVLLETYTSLSDEQIDKLSGSTDNSIDHSLSALNEYEQILSSSKNDEVVLDKGSSNEKIQQFRKLNDDLQIALNYEYYSFLKSHRSERNMMREVCPDVFAFYDCLVNKPLHQTDISPSFAFIYDNFLCDLKIALMSEDGTMELIDKITEAIDLLRGKYVEDSSKNIETAPESTNSDLHTDENPTIESSQEITSEVEPATEDRKGKPWTGYEEELMTLYFNEGIDAKSIGEKMGRSEVAIKSRLAKLGLIDYTYQAKDESDTSEDNEIEIKNYTTKCYILNKDGNIIFSDEGKLVRIREEIYRCKLQDVCFTIKRLSEKNGEWIKGGKVIVAYSTSDLYPLIDDDYIDRIEKIVVAPNFNECRVKFNGVWYNNTGGRIIEGKDEILYSDSSSSIGFDDTYDIYVPKGKLKYIPDIAKSSYDFLWTMAIVEFMQFSPQPSLITYDKIACMMIAIGWELINEETIVKEKEKGLLKSVKFLINENRDRLSLNSSRKEVYQVIERFPMYGIFEDTVDSMLEISPINVLRAWFKDEEEEDIIYHSQGYGKACLYAVYPDKREPYIMVNNKWQRSLYYDYDNLMNYFKNQYLDYLETC